ncbi:MAG: cold-shock protein [Gammaproteobacteria bacterium]
MSTFTTGIVKWFNDDTGFGCIEQKQGPDVFVHFKQFLDSNGYSSGRRTLIIGQHVQFKIARGIKGPQAEDVTAI